MQAVGTTYATKTPLHREQRLSRGGNESKALIVDRAYNLTCQKAAQNSTATSEELFWRSPTPLDC